MRVRITCLRSHALLERGTGCEPNLISSQLGTGTFRPIWRQWWGGCRCDMEQSRKHSAA
jgi:hypothetical protein